MNDPAQREARAGGGGLPWLTIRVEQRPEYFAALRRAQLDDDYRPFARFLAESFPA